MTATMSCGSSWDRNTPLNAGTSWHGTFNGTDAIQGFWQQLIDDGYCEVDYIEPSIEVVDESSAVLSANWKMNKASGVIHRELWVLQADGTAKLREDDFEAKA